LKVRKPKKMFRTKKILILCPSPKGTAPTQRLKYEQYLEQLEKEGYVFTISSFQSPRFWNIIYQPGRIIEKAIWTLAGYLKRVIDLLRIPFYDGIFVNLWVTPIGPPIFERLVLLLNKNVIYDIDDMIFIGQKDAGKKSFVQKLKGKRKPLVLIKGAAYVIVCTPKLESIGLEINKHKNVIDISSTLNTERFLPVTSYNKREVTVLGWTGSHSTIPFLHTLTPVLQKVAAKRKIKLLVIADQSYQMEGVETEFIKWTSENEVADLHKMDIGLYPIPMNEWSLGKSSLKALTYMSVALPVVTPAYGTNFRIIEDGVDGVLVKNEEEWVESIVDLIDDAEKRKRIGLAARKKVEEQFSVHANYSKYLHVIKTVVPI
jgi:L-malate glycosyltransferase